MGFTPLEGLVMATRAGSVDPGLLLWLVEHAGLAPRELSRGLEHASGLLGLAGTADLRAVLERAEAGDERAALARGVYLHRLCTGIGAMTAALGGLDALAFTGGAGERSCALRAYVGAALEFIGVAVDPQANAQATGDADISAPGATVATWVVTSREDLQIAHDVRALLTNASSGGTSAPDPGGSRHDDRH
jgi:acetate kinase